MGTKVVWSSEGGNSVDRTPKLKMDRQSTRTSGHALL
jgi:hypothetical protein